MRLFVVEGVDGSGKSTQIKLLNDFFVEKGFKCKYLHFPRTESPFFGELISRFLRGEFGTLEHVDPYLVAMLYAGDRKDAAHIVSNWLRENNIVLLDRYTYSNIAYQCAKLSDPSARKKLMDWILALEFEHFSIPRPDLNIFLDVPLSFTEKKLSEKRCGNDRQYLKGNHDIHEKDIAFQIRVREIYYSVSMSDERLVVINCSNRKGSMLEPGKIFRLIIKIITERELL